MDENSPGRAARTEPASPAPRFGFPHLVSDIPLVVWLLTALSGALFLTYSVVVPTYEAPDAPRHVDLVLAVRNMQGWPDLRGREIAREVRSSHQFLQRHGFGETRRGADEATPRAQRPGFDELPDQPPTGSLNYLTNHPPLYYAVTAGWGVLATALVPVVSDPSFDQLVGIFRAASALMLVPLPLLTFVTARRLRLRRATAVAAAVGVLGVPQLAHIGGAVNNDALLTLLMSTVMLLAVYVATGDTSRRSAVILGVVSGMALLTKGFALIALPLGAAAYLLAVLHGQLDWPRAVRLGGLFGTVAVGVGGWWWIRNALVFGALQPGILSRSPAPAGFDPELGTFVVAVWDRLITGFWGNFTNLQAPLPLAVVVAVSLVAVLGVASGLRVAGRGQDRLSKPVAGLLMAPVLLLILVLISRSWLGYVETGEIRGMQGRYLFSGLLGLAVVAARGAQDLLPTHRWRRRLPGLVGLGALGMHAGALVLLMLGLWGAEQDNSLATAVRALLVWSPWPGWVVAVLVAGLGGLVLKVGAVMLRDLRVSSTAGSRVGPATGPDDGDPWGVARRPAQWSRRRAAGRPPRDD